ncbi:polyprenol monophosphomannose synthase [Entomobacter blattae]|uniref:polyprenol monophosphomannose synthase n=1 Tax=Entomobacter blattae TaxID=2762277 RepID=UPI00193B6F5A|nr:polyprenol monophosphomannose synthase [Entomobacter blattae]
MKRSEGMPSLSTPIHSSERLTAKTGPRLSVIIPCYNEKENVSLLVEKLEKTLKGISWEAVFVDDFSPDGTYREIERIAQANSHIRGICRIGRRGLSTAVIEGILSSSAEIVVVMDGDLQHDETRIPAFYSLIVNDVCDIVVASRYLEGGNAAGLSGPHRHFFSQLGVTFAQKLLSISLTDPMSGFFAMRRSLFLAVASKLSGHGFKILLDVVMILPASVRIKELPVIFKERVAGQSKLDFSVLAAFFFMVIENRIGRYFPLKFLIFLGSMVPTFLLASLYLQNLQTGYFQTGENHTASESLLYGVGIFGALLIAYFFNNYVTFYDSQQKKFKLWGWSVFFIVCAVLSYFSPLWATETIEFPDSYSGRVLMFFCQTIALYIGSRFFIWPRK